MNKKRQSTQKSKELFFIVILLSNEFLNTSISSRDEVKREKKEVILMKRIVSRL